MPVPEKSVIPIDRRKKTGTNAYDPNSGTSRKLAHRTIENITPTMMARRDKYIEALLLGMGKTEAALYAGCTKKTAVREGSCLWREPYVQQRFRELRELLTEEQLLTKSELVLNVKSIAFSERVHALARVSASQLLAKIMNFEAPSKSQVEFLGGVMLLQAPAGGLDGWEEAALEAQKKLREQVRQ